MMKYLILILNEIDNENNLEIHFSISQFSWHFTTSKKYFLSAKKIEINLGQLIDYCKSYDDFR